jgi:subtilisin family serine protease
VVVAAAGNGGASDPASGGYPAASNPEVVSVAGLDGRALAPWTNRGSWVTVAAPGRRPALSVRGVPFTALGSSAAAAYVSGVVGVMLAANPALTPAQVVSILLTAGSPVPGLDVRSGRVLSAAAAVEAARRTTAHGSSSASTGGTSL